jgi:hypothetical protein
MANARGNQVLRSSSSSSHSSGTSLARIMLLGERVQGTMRSATMSATVMSLIDARFQIMFK